LAAESSAESGKQLDVIMTWVINTQRGQDLLIAFWSAPDEWLSRVRRCKYLRCQRFFFDRSLDKHGKYCTDRHCRVLASRVKARPLSVP